MPSLQTVMARRSVLLQMRTEFLHDVLDPPLRESDAALTALIATHLRIEEQLARLLVLGVDEAEVREPSDAAPG